jgi:hypothetical protein
MPTRELLAPSQRAQFTDFTAPLDDRTLARFYTLSDTDLEDGELVSARSVIIATGARYWPAIAAIPMTEPKIPSALARSSPLNVICTMASTCG